MLVIYSQEPSSSFFSVYVMAIYQTKLFTLIFIITVTSPLTPVFAIKFPTSHLNPTLFPTPPTVSKQIWFWELIFEKYSSHINVIHAVQFPYLIIDVIDFNKFSKKYNNEERFSRKEKEIITNRYTARYQLAIKRFKREKHKALKYGAMEKRIYSVVKSNQDALDMLFRGKISIRSQTGLADEFKRAAARAKELLPYMEESFRNHGVPTVLTRIAFVESMFNIKAKSRKGASGVWQFMPRTARRYLIVNRFIDERNSPLKATEAAAKLLKTNYHRLKSWPLAITAYNHGLSGIKRAVRTLSTNSISKIIKYYRSKSFGFASKNFYAEFLAANNVYTRHFMKSRNRTDYNPLNITFISLPSRLSIHQIMESTPIDHKILKRYNPCLSKNAYTWYRHKKLPKGFDIIIPTSIESKTLSALNKPLRKG